MGKKSTTEWTPPPNWPRPEPGWQPPPGWQPDPAWGPAPEGWNFYPKPWEKMSTAEKKAADPSRAKGDTRKGLAVLAVIGLVVAGCVAVSGGEDDATTAASTSEVATEKPTAPAPAATEAAAPEPAEAAAPEPAESEVPEEPAETSGQRNAKRAAENYLSMMAFSRDGLIQQLSSDAGDGYSVEDATYAVDALNTDYNEQAYKAAKNYLSMMAFSRQGLIEQLSSAAGDGYTIEQATYGADKALAE